MSSKFDVEFKNLIKVYEANDNIEPGPASGFADALFGLAKTAYGIGNYLFNFKKFYKYALRQSYKINDEYIQIRSAGDQTSISSIKKRSKLQYTINTLREDINKWKQYLKPVSTKSAQRCKASLDVIESILSEAERGTLGRRGRLNKDTSASLTKQKSTTSP
jgi:hypothetical protein